MTISGQNPKIGNKVIRFEELDSTNDQAKRMIKEKKVSDGLVIRADYQSAGKGQLGRKWFSESGVNLMFTVVLQPTCIQLDRQFDLNMFVALAVWDFVARKIRADVRIKWPNDIMADGQKIAGILIQNLVQGKRLENAIIGIGVNINQKDFPRDASNPTSLSSFAGQTFDIDLCYTDIFKSLNTFYQELKSDPDNLRLEFIKRLYHLNESMEFETDKRFFTGEIKGIDESGRLHIWDGIKNMYFNHGEVRFAKSAIK